MKPREKLDAEQVDLDKKIDAQAARCRRIRRKIKNLKAR